MTSTANPISIGDVPIVTSTVLDEDGAPIDPPSRTGHYLSPSGRTGDVTPALTSTVGTIETMMPEADERGRWFYWIDFNGTADDGYYDVGPAPAA